MKLKNEPVGSVMTLITCGVFLAVAGIIVCIGLLQGGTFGVVPGARAYPTINSETGDIVVLYYGTECPHCHEIMPLFDRLEAEHPEWKFKRLEIYHNEMNRASFRAVNDRLLIPGFGVPEVVIGSTAFVGSQAIQDNLEGFLDNTP